jgi:hypothetical protein
MIPARRDLVPAIWLPDPRVRAERERARWRLHLVRQCLSIIARLAPMNRDRSKTEMPARRAKVAYVWRRS